MLVHCSKKRRVGGRQPPICKPLKNVALVLETLLSSMRLVHDYKKAGGLGGLAPHLQTSEARQLFMRIR